MGARVIAKVLMPCVDPTKKVAEYTTLYKIVECITRLIPDITQLPKL